MHISERNKEEIRMKEPYIPAEMEIVYFDTEDIITSSTVCENELPLEFASL